MGFADDKIRIEINAPDAFTSLSTLDQRSEEGAAGYKRKVAHVIQGKKRFTPQPHRNNGINTCASYQEQRHQQNRRHRQLGLGLY